MFQKEGPASWSGYSPPTLFLGLFSVLVFILWIVILSKALHGQDIIGWGLSIGKCCVKREGSQAMGPQNSRLLFSHSRLFATPWTAAPQASLSFTNSRSLLKLMSVKSVMPSNHLLLCRPLLRLPSVFPSVRIFSNELALCIRWPKYWSFNLSISLPNEYSGLISFRID